VKTKAKRPPSPRDMELLKFLHEVSVGPESMVWPLSTGKEKTSTMRAVVLRLIHRNSLPIYVAVNAMYPSTLLVSRTPIGRNIKKD